MNLLVMNVSFGSRDDWMESLKQQSVFERMDFALDLDSDAKHNDYFVDYLQYNIYRHRNLRNFCERKETILINANQITHFKKL